MSGFINTAAKWLGGVPLLGDYFNNLALNKFAKAIPPRPRPLAMNAPYTNWPGLTDRRISGRHLPPDEAFNSESNLPDLDAVTALFQQTEDKRANDTSLLFPFFAQWFTDSFLRTQWKPEGKQDFVHNESNHEIDLCQIYGTNEDRTTLLRSLEGGRLKSQQINGEEYPVHLFEEVAGQLQVKPEFKDLYSEDNFKRVYSRASDRHKRNAFAVGLEHGNSTIGNTVMNILFLREHNRIAGELKKSHPDWDDERLFQTARNVNIVLLLNIVISDYIVHINSVDFPLRAIPGFAEKQNWYRANWITVEFALLYRWHSFIPQTVHFGGIEEDSVALTQNIQWLLDVGISTICKDASAQKAGMLGLGNTVDFLLPTSKLSLTMGRTCQLQSYNDYRRYYGLDPKTSFEDLTGEKALASKLKALYKDINNLEWFVGIFAESYGESEMMGGLLTTMVANDAFTQALTNPLLSENIYNEATFSKVGLDIINSGKTLADIVERNTTVTDKDAIGFRVRPYTGPAPMRKEKQPATEEMVKA